MKKINCENGNLSQMLENVFLCFFSCKKVVFVTGAGISTNAGIPVTKFKQRILDHKTDFMI